MPHSSLLVPVVEIAIVGIAVVEIVVECVDDDEAVETLTDSSVVVVVG